MMKSMTIAALLTIAAVAPAPASASTVAGFDASSLPRCDDCFSGAESLGFSANFFGTTYTDAFVSNNGYLTFGAGQGEFTPRGLGASYVGLPIIAALFTDLDTRDEPSVATSYGTGTFGGRQAFGINYDDVGLYPGNYANLNSFQILLVNRSDVAAGDFDIVFNYDDIQFGANAAAGYNAGQPGSPDGTYYELPGSLSGEAFANGGEFALARGGNGGTPGRYVFNVRGGDVVVPPAVPEPATWAMMIGGLGGVGGMARRSRRTVRVAFA